MTNSPSPIGATIPLVDLQGNLWELSTAGVAGVNGVTQTVTHGIGTLLRAPPLRGALGIWQQTALGWWEALAMGAKSQVKWDVVTPTNPLTVASPPPPPPPPIVVPPAPKLVAPKIGVHLGTYLGGGQGTSGSIAKHLADFTAAVGAPTIVSAVAINSYQDGYATPSEWGGDVAVWTAANGLAMDGSMVPMLDLRMTDGVSTDTDYAGVIAGKYDVSLITMMIKWKMQLPNVKTMYARFPWEFNTSTFDWEVPVGQSANWCSAFAHWADLLHTWGDANGVDVRTVWCPDTSFAASGNVPGNVADYFPTPALSKIGRRVVDVVGPDHYMNGYGIKLPESMLVVTNTSDWSLGAFIALAKANGANFAISETGDGPIFDNNQSAGDGAQTNFETVLAGLAAQGVPLEYVSIYDSTSGGATQCSGSPGVPAVAAGWKAMFANLTALPPT